MLFNIIIIVFFGAIVFFHYLQGFFSSTISAILAVFAAILAFSWHETIVESLLQGKVANMAHAMVLVVLFAAIYVIFRSVFDALVPEGVEMPQIIDRIGGALMGCVVATYTLGIFAIAAQELPFGAGVGGYTKYSTQDRDISLQVAGSFQNQQGHAYYELNSNSAGAFNETDRSHMFPFYPAGADEIVVGTVAYLSSRGSMASLLPTRPLSAVHPDFLQELYGQRAGYQAGVTNVAVNLPTQSQPAVTVEGIYSVSKVRIVDNSADGIRRAPPTTPLKLETPFTIINPQSGRLRTKEVVTYATAAKDPDNGKPLALLVVRLSFGPDAAESDHIARFGLGAFRLVANRDGEPHNYYPIGTLEFGNPSPMLFAGKPDDPVFVEIGAKEQKAAIDVVFAVDKPGTLEEVQGKKPTIAADTFIEIKRMVRQDLSGKVVEDWKATGPNLLIQSLHQRALTVNVDSAEKPTKDDK